VLAFDGPAGLTCGSLHIDQPVFQSLHLSCQFIEATREIQHVRVQLLDLMVCEADGLLNALNTPFKSR
jgi:hypothetical protein